MGCAAPVDHLGLLDGQARDVLQVGVRRVHHQGGIHLVEGAPPHHDHLAAPTLLGGSPEDPDPAPKAVSHRRSGQAGPQTSGGDDVVTAGVADPGEGVVLAEDRHDRAPGARRPLKGRLEAVGGADHVDSLVGKHPRQQLVGKVLLEGQLGLVVDGPRGLQEHACQLVDPLADRPPGRIHRVTCRVAHRQDPTRGVPGGSEPGSDRQVEGRGLDPHREVPGPTDNLAIQTYGEGPVEGCLDRRNSPVVDGRMWNVVAPLQATPGRQVRRTSEPSIQHVQQPVAWMGPGSEVPMSVVGGVGRHPPSPEAAR